MEEMREIRGGRGGETRDEAILEKGSKLPDAKFHATNQRGDN